MKHIVACSFEVQADWKTRIAKWLTSSAQIVSALNVVTSRNAQVKMKRIQRDKPTNRVLPAYGIYKVPKCVSFDLIVMNVSKRPGTLWKKVMIAVGIVPSKTIMT